MSVMRLGLCDKAPYFLFFLFFFILRMVTPGESKILLDCCVDIFQQ